MWNIAVSMSVCVYVHSHISKTAHPKLTKFSVYVNCDCGSVCLWWHCNTLFTSGFVGDLCFHVIGHVMYSKAYGLGISVSGRQHRKGQSFNASSPSLSTVPTADWHPSAVSLAIHNAVWLWRQTVHCTWGRAVCYCLLFLIDLLLLLV